MNIETLNYISKIAGFAADQLKSGKTLKASKAWLADAMNADTTPYTAEGVDFEVVNARRSLNDAVDARTKAVFVCQCNNALAFVAKHHDAAVMNMRAAHSVKVAARDHGVTLTIAQVIEWANGDVHFNFTKAAHELAHAAKEAEAAEVKGVANIAEAAGLFDLWELFDRSPMKSAIDNLEMHYVTALNDEHAGGDAATAAQRLFGFNPGDSLTYAFNAVCNQAREDLQIHIEASHEDAIAIEAERAMEAHWREAQEERAAIVEERDAFQMLGLFAKRQAIEAAHAEALAENDRFDWLANRHAIFFGGYDFGARRTMIETAHAEALRIEAEREYLAAVEAQRVEDAATKAASLTGVRSKRDVMASPAPRKPRTAYRKRLTRVEVAATANGVNTYRIHMSNGRVYLYTEGEAFAQVKLTGGHPRSHSYETVASEYTLQRLRQAIHESRA